MSLHPHHTTPLAIATLAGLLLTACASGGDETEENATTQSATPTATSTAGAGESTEAWDPADPENELTVHCTDADALPENADREPTGWPQDWEEGEPMPDPECHPDFIEVESWALYEEFMACWEGPETGTAVREPDMTDQDTYEILWSQSRDRAEWEIPRGDGAPVEGASEDCIALYEDDQGSNEM